MNLDPSNAAPVGIALIGLALGMRHATDADHVIAITTIVSRERKLTAASTIGVVWGLGHALTILVVGAAIIVFKITIPARLGLAMEFAVAVVLILLGASAIGRLLGGIGTKEKSEKMLVHSHVHSHGLLAHSHPHAHEQASGKHSHRDHLLAEDASLVPPMSRPFLKAFGVGLVHGLAGSAAIALLVLAAIPDPLWSIAYLAVFGVGTLIGMVLITTAISMPIMFASGRIARLQNTAGVAAGLLSFSFGLFLAYQIAFVDGLFASLPLWIPH